MLNLGLRTPKLWKHTIQDGTRFGGIESPGKINFFFYGISNDVQLCSAAVFGASCEILLLSRHASRSCYFTWGCTNAKIWCGVCSYISLSRHQYNSSTSSMLLMQVPAVFFNLFSAELLLRCASFTKLCVCLVPPETFAIFCIELHLFLKHPE